jgi:Fe-S oxidoreductase
MSPLCWRPFQSNQFSKAFDAFADYGLIACPHCGTTIKGNIDSMYLSHALSTQEEADFNIQHPASPLR